MMLYLFILFTACQQQALQTGINDQLAIAARDANTPAPTAVTTPAATPEPTVDNSTDTSKTQDTASKTLDDARKIIKKINIIKRKETFKVATTDTLGSPVSLKNALDKESTKNQNVEILSLYDEKSNCRWKEKVTIEGDSDAKTYFYDCSSLRDIHTCDEIRKCTSSWTTILTGYTDTVTVNDIDIPSTNTISKVCVQKIGKSWKIKQTITYENSARLGPIPLKRQIYQCTWSHEPTKDIDSPCLADEDNFKTGSSVQLEEIVLDSYDKSTKTLSPISAPEDPVLSMTLEGDATSSEILDPICELNDTNLNIRFNTCTKANEFKKINLTINNIESKKTNTLYPLDKHGDLKITKDTTDVPITDSLKFYKVNFKTLDSTDDSLSIDASMKYSNPADTSTDGSSQFKCNLIKE
jgi:hypothetical protein